MEPSEINEQSRQSDIALMLKAYEESWTQVRHVDEFGDRVPRFFLIVVGAVTAALAVMIRLSELGSSAFEVAGIILIILAFVGLVASFTIPRYRVIRNKYFEAIYHIHKYFVDKRAELKNYLKLQIGGSFKGYYHPLRVDFFRFLMMVIMDSGLIAAGLYVLENSEALAGVGDMVSPRQWIWHPHILLVVFISAHIGAYFGIIWWYKHKE